MNGNRVPLVDFLRGAAVLNMLIFHLCYDINVINGSNLAWPQLWQVRLWQQCIVLSFIFVSGMSFNLISGGKVRKGIKLLLLGEIITLATKIFIPAEAIYYGVISFMGGALLLSHCLENSSWQLLSKVRPYGGAILCGICFILFYNITAGYVSLVGKELYNLPAGLYEQNWAFLGFPRADFVSADYVPLLPHIFIYWLGIYAYRILAAYKLGLLQKCDRKPLCFLGRNSLLVYLLHQPILLGILAVF